MFISAHYAPTRLLARRTHVINKDTGQEITRVIWSNDETGRYRQYLTNEKGEVLLNKERTKVLSKIFKANIKLELIEI